MRGEGTEQFTVQEIYRLKFFAKLRQELQTENVFETRARNCDHFGRICSRNVICATPKYIWEHLCECK